MAEETVTQTTTAEEGVESATTGTEVKPVETTEGAASVTAEEKPTEGAPEQSKAVKELISVRKRAQLAEAELAHFKSLATQTATPEAKADTKAEPLVMPKSEDFKTWDEFEDAKGEYYIAKAEERFAAKYNTNLQKHNTEAIEKDFQERIALATEENPILEDILADKNLTISPAMAEVIKGSDMSPQLLIYLNDNRKEAKRLSLLSPVMAAREMGKLEATIATAPKPAPPKKISSAPEPIKTVSGVGETKVDEDKLPIDDWVARRNAAQFPKRKQRS